MIGMVGRNRAIDRTVKPVSEMQMMAATPISVAARQPAAVIASVSRDSPSVGASRRSRRIRRAQPS